MTTQKNINDQEKNTIRLRIIDQDQANIMLKIIDPDRHIWWIFSKVERGGVKNGDTLSLVTEEGGMENVFSALGKQKKSLKKILLVGGSKTARFLLKDFSQSDRRSFALVDNDSEVCKSFAEQFPEILIIKADVTDETLYEDEDIDSYDYSTF
jgi:hypothetical protein